ncbi:hypothetical protein JX266_006096 [Neoarthrinium moseri]|nr:hypothetical protein JX266_006096 [Neoarthrinium moseri]
MSSPPVILVTAGSAGLGAAVAHCFAENGFRVVINYRSSADKAAKLLSNLPRQSHATNDTHICVQADLESRGDVERLVTQAYLKMGRLDVVFSNGGWTKPRDMESIEDNMIEEEWDRAFKMNVKSHLWLLYAARAQLDATEGCFISTASVSGMGHNGSSLAYSVTKAAQLHMIRGLACMAGPKIRVNSVSPGLLQTEWAERFPPAAQEAHRQKTKLKRMTGVNIVVDAGYIL